MALSPSFFLSLANGDSIQVQRDRRQILPSAVNHDQRLINRNQEEPLVGLGEKSSSQKKDKYADAIPVETEDTLNHMCEVSKARLQQQGRSNLESPRSSCKNLPI